MSETKTAPRPYHYVRTLRGEPGFDALLDRLMACEECDGGTVEYAKAPRHSAQIDQEWGEGECEARHCHGGTLELVDCQECGAELDRDTVAAIERETHREYVYALCAACAKGTE